MGAGIPTTATYIILVAVAAPANASGEEDSAADALDHLRDAGFEDHEYEILTGTPYPEGTFGEAEPQHHLYRWPIFGALTGFTISLFYTSITQAAYPILTGGKPVLAIPAMLVILYELTMLGAVIFTIGMH